MIRYLGIALVVFLMGVFGPQPSVAEGNDDLIVEMTVDRTSTMPGRPVVLRLTVLVPTWMPKPPVLPTFDLPNLHVLLPERATNPTSRRINRTLWTGLTRVYHLYPMSAGEYRLPPQVVEVTYADPSTRAPINRSDQTASIALSVTVPDAAADLDPFIAATGLTLSQNFDGHLENMEQGDAIIREVVATVEGAPPLILPPLVTDAPVRGMSTYRRSPRLLTETNPVGGLIGSRVEEISYVIEAGGRFSIPPVAIEWFNLETGEIERAEVPGLGVKAQGTPLSFAKEVEYWGAIIVRWAVLLIGLSALALVLRQMAPLIATYYGRVRDVFYSSETYAYWTAQAAIGRHKMGTALSASQYWARTFATHKDALPPRLGAAFLALGARGYGPDPARGQSTAQLWRRARRALRDSRQATQRRNSEVEAASLPALNPGASERELGR